MRLNVAERRHEMHFGAAAIGRCRRPRAAPPARRGETPSGGLRRCARSELQPVGQRIDHRHADAVQPAGNLVAVLVELAAGVQLGHHDLGGRAPLVVVVLDVGRNAAAVVDDRHRVVGVDDDLDVVAVARQRLVDRVVEHLEHHVMQAGAVGRVADVHARALAYGIEALQDLDAGRIVVVAVLSRLGLCWGHRDFRFELPIGAPVPRSTNARAPSVMSRRRMRGARCSWHARSDCAWA